MSFISPIPTDSNGNELTTGHLKELGKDDFLQLLVAKLEYQDPLNPVSDESFIAELAQFSSLEQMSNISEAIQSSNQWDYLQMQSINNAMASGLIGKEVKASYDNIYYEHGSNPTVSYSLDEPVVDLTFTIRDESGNIVATLSDSNLSAGTHKLSWDGTDQQGNRVDEGEYSVEAAGMTASGDSVQPKLSVVGKVSEIVYRDGSTYVRVGGAEIPLSDITAVADSGVYTEED